MKTRKTLTRSISKIFRKKRRDDHSDDKVNTHSLDRSHSEPTTDTTLETSQEETLTLFELIHKGFHNNLIVISKLASETNFADRNEYRNIVRICDDMLTIVSNYSHTEQLSIFNNIRILQNAYETIESCAALQFYLQDQYIFDLKHQLIELEDEKNSEELVRQGLGGKLVLLMDKFSKEYMEYMEKVSTGIYSQLGHWFSDEDIQVIEHTMLRQYPADHIPQLIKAVLPYLDLSERSTLFQCINKLSTASENMKEVFGTASRTVLGEEEYSQLVHCISSE